jgi:hypothetical protein
MDGRRRRVIALTTIGILMAATMVAGGWWVGQRGEQQPAGSGITTAPSTSPPATVTNPPATGGPTPTTLAGTGIWQRLPAAPLPAGPSYYYAGVWTGSELLINGPVYNDPAGIPKGRSAAYNPATRT